MKRGKGGRVNGGEDQRNGSLFYIKKIKNTL
jgi:hypothetical protein